MECPKCQLKINCKADVYTMCDGGCCQSFHASCVSLPEPVVGCLSKNVIWLCDNCLASFYEHTSRNFCAESQPTLSAELTAIKEQIAGITEVLSNIVPRTSSRDETPSSIQCVPSHSTPISSSLLTKGCRIVERIEDSRKENCSPTEASGCTAGGNKETFSLFLTNIDASVTEQEINCMVVQSLGVVENEAVEVVKLVPKWKPIGSLRYVSFKILLDAKLKGMALDPKTWPDGVMFRTFIEHPRRTWKPTTR